MTIPKIKFERPSGNHVTKYYGWALMLHPKRKALEIYFGRLGMVTIWTGRIY